MDGNGRTGREHDVHQEAAGSSIPVHIGMDVDEDEVAENDADRGLGFLA